LWNNSPNEITGNYEMHYSDIQGSEGGGTNYDIDPLFSNPEEGDYHLLGLSQLIGSGIMEYQNWQAPEYDIDGNPRPNPAGSFPDIGVYENPLEGPQNSEIYVSVNGSDETGDGTEENPLATIQYALSLVYNRGIILVQPGEYFENIDFSGKNVTIKSVEGFENTIINGDQMDCVVTFENEENAEAVLDGFTITNGEGLIGGGILCYNSQPTLKNLLIKENEATSGGGIACLNSDILIQNVVVVNNISINFGGGMYCYNSDPILTNITVSGNSADLGGGISCLSNSDPILTNCILWDNVPHEIRFHGDTSPNSITITYSDIQEGEEGIETNDNGIVNWLEGNIDNEPLFVGTGDYPFSLQDLSPCINTGTPDTTGLNLPEFDLAGNLRVYGERIDMGAYENQNVFAVEDLIPVITSLNNNYPNPFNPSTKIEFSIEQNQQNEQTKLIIYNLKGQKVKQLVSDQLSAGRYSVIWNGKDDNNKPVSSGVYFYKLKSGNFEKIRKMILMK
ncbi:MAG TPA: T9SS type A sorting domain-containing protein, partial [Candidatus Cloacimonetes bacterium]|nr:T9SS type A sorting domain-containing protein [Candidatus Cloacimonadota bacterium]